MPTRSRVSSWVWLVVTLVVVPLLATLLLDSAAAAASPAKPIRFFDAPSQAAEFIGYNRSIALNPGQHRVRDKALSAMPAACCEKFSQATCCCPCNLAKTVWGLSNYLITRQHANVPELQTAVRGWLAFVNPKGFSGDICDSPGGCGRSFGSNGCGGMDERNLLAAR